MKITDKFKDAMKIHGVTYEDIGNIIDRKAVTVRQRLRYEETFHTYQKEYKRALEICIDNKNKQSKKALDELKGETK